MYAVYKKKDIRGQGARFVGAKGRRYKLWWSGHNDGMSGVGILVYREVGDKVVKVRKKSDRVMAMALVFEEEVTRVISACKSQARRPDFEK